MERKKLKVLPKEHRKRLIKMAKQRGIKKRDIDLMRSRVGSEKVEDLLQIGAVVMLAKLGGKLTITKEQYEAVIKPYGGMALIATHAHGDTIEMELTTMPKTALPGEITH